MFYPPPPPPPPNESKSKRPPSRFLLSSFNESTGATEDENLSPHQWNMEDTFGCRPKCASNVHGVTAYDLLWIHSEFLLPTSEQRLWMLEYLSVNCPNAGVSGAKDAKGIAFLICGKLICQTLWLKALPLCSS